MTLKEYYKDLLDLPFKRNITPLIGTKFPTTVSSMLRDYCRDTYGFRVSMILNPKTKVYKIYNTSPHKLLYVVKGV